MSDTIHTCFWVIMSWWLIIYLKQIKWILIKYNDYSLYRKRIHWIWIRYLLYNSWIDMGMSRLYSSYFQISMIDLLHVKLITSAWLMPLHVWWRLESQNLHWHPKKTKVWASSQGWGSIDYKRFFLFLMPVQVLWRSCSVCFVFLMPVHVLSKCAKMKKISNLVSPAFQTLQVQITL